MFGDVFEHTPAIAQSVHAAGLSEAEDDAAGLHRVLVAAMRAMPGAAQDALLAAHPDLAGRLALAGDLTASSAGEQASAGLDRLSSDELARFTALNTRYRQQFGFPFIIAVKGLDKAAILHAFETRLAQGRDAERAEALRQVERIALSRVQAVLPDRPAR